MDAHGKHDAMFQEDKAYLVVSLLGKYGYFKEELFRAWASQAKSRASPEFKKSKKADSPEFKKSKKVLAVIRAALFLIHKKVAQEVHKAWSRNVGKGVEFHSGFLPFLQRLGVLSQSESPKSLVLSANQQKRYEVCGLRDKDVLGRLQHLSRAGDCLWNALAIPPLTCGQWCLKQQLVLEARISRGSVLGSLIG